MTPINLDRIFLGVALVVASASFGWTVRQGWAQDRVHRSAHRPGVRAVAAEEPASQRVIRPTTAKWLPPSAQSRGREWIYDLFTPPEIHFDAGTRQFAVTPPDDPTRRKNPVPGLELVAVKREPFRLQLVGYVGGEGHFRGAFENRLTTEVVLAGPGQALPDLELEITEFSVRRGMARLADGTGSRQRIATAVVRDARTGGCTTLTAGESSYTDELRAVLATQEDDGEAIREYRAGEELESLDRTYKIARLQLEPPSAELTQITTNFSPPARFFLAARMSPSAPSALPASFSP